MTSTIASRPSTDVVVATSADDAAAVEAVKAHHAELAGSLRLLTDQVVATTVGDSGPRDEARSRLLAFCTGELVPHALAEEEALYPAAATTDRARLLVDAMLAEHQLIVGLVHEVRDAPDPVRAAASAGALRVLFDSHLAKENDLILPVLAADPSVSLHDVLGGMHELLGGHAGSDAASDADRDQPAGHGHGACGCGHQDTGEVPELDVRAVPHAIRHATVFGAFDAIPAGGSLVLVAPHDPLPLLKQLTARAENGLDVSYLERGPEAWRLQLTRR